MVLRGVNVYCDSLPFPIAKFIGLLCLGTALRSCWMQSPLSQPRGLAPARSASALRTGDQPSVAATATSLDNPHLAPVGRG